MSCPTLQEFDPRKIPWQFQAIKYFNKFNYNTGVLELLFSGSIGSAKSVEAAHMIALHAINNEGSRTLVVRRALKDLKRTLWQLILAHLSDSPQLIKNYNKSEMKITLINNSEIIGDSYDDMNLEKFRSLELSAAVIEEASESNESLYNAIKMRLGRIGGVRQNFMLALTNPDEPSHYLYEKIIQADDPNKKVFYSLTEQNPFLPEWYITSLKKDLDPLMARRMLYGEWISIQGKTPYYAYESLVQFRKSESYQVDENLPLDIMHDFNIGTGKPMSAAVGQFKDGAYHIAKDFVVEGFNTKEIISEMLESGLFEKASIVRVFGDFNGLNKDTRSSMNDYDIIMKELGLYTKKNGGKLTPKLHVPRSGNPPIKSRQNVVNAYCKNELGQVRLYVYRDAKTVDKGLRLTKIKKGSGYQEDDSDEYQHVVTALGYYIYEHSTRLRSSGVKMTVGKYQ